MFALMDAVLCGLPRGLTSISTRAIYNLQCITVSTNTLLLLILGTATEEIIDDVSSRKLGSSFEFQLGHAWTCGRLFSIMTSLVLEDR
jgi:hypothetical protein